jgi:hypothetical protein
MLIFVAKILWSTAHAPQNAYIGAPQMRFSLLVNDGTIINLSTELVIDVSSGSGKHVILNTLTGTPTQQWQALL